ncbi:MAG: AlkZ-related protein [Chloroflexota bacterium]
MDATTSHQSATRLRRLENWCQTPETRTADAAAAAHLIDRVGVATLYPVSSEIPNLFHAYVGDPEAKTDSKWDSPSGHVYTWRWELGKREVAFYAAIVRKKPTWVSWQLLPAVLRLLGEFRNPSELYEAGALSAGAYRIARALEETDHALSTGELREAAGFPTGKEQRAAYLKAIAELESRLLIAKVFSPAGDDRDPRHALVRRRYPEHVASAGKLSREAALDQLLSIYLAAAVDVAPDRLAKDLGIPASELRAGIARLSPDRFESGLDVPRCKVTSP